MRFIHQLSFSFQGYLLTFPTWRVLAEVRDNVVVKIALNEGGPLGSVSLLPCVSPDGGRVSLTAIIDEDTKEQVRPDRVIVYLFTFS